MGGCTRLKTYVLCQVHTQITKITQAQIIIEIFYVTNLAFIFSFFCMFASRLAVGLIKSQITVTLH